jgi:branched-chain amino acid transport system substrate-binding protein
VAPVARGAFLAGGAAAVAAAAVAAATVTPARAQNLTPFSTPTPFGGIGTPLPFNGTVTIGVVGPFTGPNRLGEQMANGARAAVDDANQLLGTLDKAFQIQTFDDQNLLASALVTAEFACDDPQIVAVIGHLSGRITEAAMQTYVRNQMQVISPASSYERLTQHGYGNLLRLVTKDSAEGHLAARRVNALLKPKSVVSLSQDGDYGPDVADGFHAQMKGDKVASTPISFSLDKPDFAGVAKSVVAANPDVVFLAGLTKDMGPVVPALVAAGYTGAFYGSQGFFDATTIATYGSSLEGLTVSSSMPPLKLAPGAFRIKNDFEQKYGGLTPLSTFSYAAAQIIIAVVRRTNAGNRVAVERAFNVPTAFDTLIGSLVFGATGDLQDPNIYFYTVTSGAWKYAGSAYPNGFVVK